LQPCSHDRGQLRSPDRNSELNSTGASTYNRGNRVSWISVGFATPSYQEVRRTSLKSEAQDLQIFIIAERANALLKVIFKALRLVSLNPAALTLLQLEHGCTS
ncbi:hypothetical protein ACWCPM_34095, partial [Streptomyces sp. NPDC002309]